MWLGANNRSIVSGVPTFTVTVQDWSSGSAVDSGTLTLTTLLRSGVQFSDADLAADVPGGWDEYGPVETTYPELSGIRFSAKLIDIKPGGIYPSGAKRISVMQYAVDLRAGMYGDSLPARTYAPAHKVVIKQNGVLVDTIQMHDGLPINDASFEQDWYTVHETPAKYGKSVRPWVSVGQAYHSFCGTSRPYASTTTKNAIPRATSDWESVRKSIGDRQATNGGGSTQPEWHYGFGYDTDNGNAHPSVMPQWGKTRNDLDAGISTSDTTLVYSSAGQWAAAYAYGWDYEPGVYGGITRRGGPGGVRADRSALPAEFIQSYLVAPAGTRPHDGAAYESMADAQIRNYCNFAAYRPRDLADLRPVDTISSPNSSPVAVGETHKYYQTWYAPQAYTGTSGIRVVSENGVSQTTLLEGVRTTHPWAGWEPEGEHNNRLGMVYGTLLRADPLFAHFADFMATDGLTISGWMKSRVYTYGSTEIADPASWTFGNRTFMCDFLHALGAWKISTTASVNSRANIEATVRAYIISVVDGLFASIPGSGSESNAAQVGWNNFKAMVEWRSDTSGGVSFTGWWCLMPIAHLYVAEFLSLAKAWGFRTAMETGGTSAENTKVTSFFSKMEENHRFYSLCFSSNPAMWYGSGLPLRASAQGAVQATLSTIPATASAVIANYASRSDWWNDAGGQKYTDNATLATAAWRIKASQMYWQFVAAAGSERTTELGKIATSISGLLTAFGTGRPVGYLHRFAWTQSIPVTGF